MNKIQKRALTLLVLISLAVSSLFYYTSGVLAQDLNQHAINDGISYLRSQQDTTGQISGFSGVSGWAAMTFAAADINPATVSNGGTSLLDYLSLNPPATSSPATDWERTILAITAAGTNPYDFGGIDYVAKLETYHNNSQLGSTTLVNDDIFGLLAFVSAGSGAPNSTKQDALNFTLSHQNSDGGFSWSTTGSSDIDDTAAGLLALVAAQNAGISAPNLSTAITNAKNFIIASKNSDGGFPYTKGDSSNTSTASWVVMALSALDVTGWDVTNAKSYIRGSQEENGSFRWQPSSTGETFTTSYAVMALTGKFWPVKVFAGNPTPSPSPTISPSPSPSVTNTPTPSPTASPTPIPTVTPTTAPVPSVTANPSPNPTVTGRPNLYQRLQELERRRLERLQAVRERQKSILQRILDRIRRFTRE